MKIDIRCNGLPCDEDLGQNNAEENSDHEWCELLLSQHVPQGAYIDVDEVKVRTQGKKRGKDQNVSCRFHGPVSWARLDTDLQSFFSASDRSLKFALQV